jgi:hypothetical protein
VVAFVTAHILASGRLATCHIAPDNLAMIRTALSVGYVPARREGEPMKDVTIAMVALGGYANFYLRQALRRQPRQGLPSGRRDRPQPRRLPLPRPIRGRGHSDLPGSGRFLRGLATADLVIIAAPIQYHAAVHLQGAWPTARTCSVRNLSPRRSRRRALWPRPRQRRRLCGYRLSVVLLRDDAGAERPT